ncbi:MAG: hypothetical protein ABIH20_06880, partial [Candidatus Diapherotrites archaeon]
GIVLFLASIPLFWANQLVLAAISLGISGIIGALGLLSTLQFTFYAWSKDKTVALASIVIIPLRTIAFQIGLVTGFITHNILKGKK